MIWFGKIATPSCSIFIDLNRLRRYRTLEFRQPVTQGKHSVKRSLYKALHKRLSLVLRRCRPARTISYRPFLKHQRFAVWSLLFVILNSSSLGYLRWTFIWCCFFKSWTEMQSFHWNRPDAYFNPLNRGFRCKLLAKAYRKLIKDLSFQSIKSLASY